MPNLLIPCSGPGTRSVGYTKFHKALIRIGDCAVIDHIINSFADIEKIYITLGFEAEYIREYIQHSSRKNVEFIEIENWNSSQISSFKQIPSYVFDEPLYYNACDNWSTSVATVDNNTWFTCTPDNAQYYDTSEDVVYSGISYIKDSREYYDILQATDINRNDLLLLQQLNNLQSVALDDWYDVGNQQSYKQTIHNYKESFDVLDKTNQEVYSINKKIIKFWDKKPNISFDNDSFPHPQPVVQTDNAISYNYVEGVVNPYQAEYTKLLDSLTQMWNFCIANNNPVYDTQLWQDKTWERFNSMIEQVPEFGNTIMLNGKTIDPTRVIEDLPWARITSGIKGPCHGDLVLDNIVVGKDNIAYIDHRQGAVNDIYYDVCKFYHSLFLHNVNLKNAWHLTENENEYIINLKLSELDNERIKQFRFTELYKHAKDKIETCVGCIWLSMSPLNVDQELNKFLFLLAIEKLNEHT